MLQLKKTNSDKKKKKKLKFQNPKFTILSKIPF